MFSRLLKTKTFWTGLSGIAAGAALCAAHDWPQGITLILGGLAAIFVRDAVAKLPAAPRAKR